MAVIDASFEGGVEAIAILRDEMEGGMEKAIKNDCYFGYIEKFFPNFIPPFFLVYSVILVLFMCKFSSFFPP